MVVLRVVRVVKVASSVGCKGCGGGGGGDTDRESCRCHDATLTHGFRDVI